MLKRGQSDYVFEYKEIRIKCSEKEKPKKTEMNK